MLHSPGPRLAPNLFTRRCMDSVTSYTTMVWCISTACQGWGEGVGVEVEWGVRSEGEEWRQG